MSTLRTRVLGKPVEISVSSKPSGFGDGTFTEITSGNYSKGFYTGKNSEDSRMVLTNHGTGQMLLYAISDRIAEVIGNDEESVFYSIICDTPMTDLRMARIAHMVAMDY